VLCALLFALCSLDLNNVRWLNHQTLFKSPNTPDPPEHRRP
jgi:hypothetical protein